MAEIMDNVKGFNDYTSQEALTREKIKNILVQTFKLYGFEPAETPIIEYEEFVKQGNEFDEAVSDIFKLKDKGQRALALRYEFTFQLKRLAKNKKLPYKRYQIGEVFRDEPVSSARFRQFTQADADVVGSSIQDEAEILALASQALKQLGIKSVINVNNRNLLNQVLESLDITNKEFVLREIDKLDKQGEDTVKVNLNKFIDKLTIIKLFKLFNKPLSAFKKFPAYKEILELKKYCGLYKIKINFQPSLARGLSYYNGNVFEIKTAGKEKLSIAAGGSYLINNIQSTGISFGIERLTQLAKIKPKSTDYLIISINQDKKATNLAQKLRQAKKSVIISDKISKALDYANSSGIEKVIFLGKEEIKKKKLKLRDMKTGKEKMLSEKELFEKNKDMFDADK